MLYVLFRQKGNARVYKYSDNFKPEEVPIITICVSQHYMIALYFFFIHLENECF